MSKAINNPNFIATNDEPLTQAPTTGQILDGFDFPHTGLIKVFNLACAGSYAIRGFNGTNIGATSARFAGGAVFLKGALTSISGPTTVTISGNTPKTHHLLVARAGAIVLIQGTVDNEIPPFADGDVIIALLKYTGANTTMQIQYLTFNQTSKALSIGRLNTNTNQYLEGLSIKSTPSGNSIGDIIIESFEQDKDIVFKVNDGGSPSQEILRIDASDKEVYLDKGYLHLKSDDAGEAPKLTLENRNNGVDAGAIHFLKDGSSPANNDKIGTIIFESESALNADCTYADIMVYSKDTTNSAEHGRMNFRISKAGSLVSALDINDDEIVVNETSKDINFRVESDTNQNMFVVDASTNRVGIGTNSPAETLDVNGAIKALTAIKSLGTIHSPQLEVVPSNSASLALTAATHAGRYLLYSGSNGTITLPATSTTGEHYTILNLTGGNITLNPNGSTTINGGSGGAGVTVGTYNGVTCIAIANNNWIVLGV